ncbi:branched-chain amino acid ABC transporter permease [Prosthecomicrobium sp. N25]|uniref:branched-chain amino acid ABC transporter permease n=1 Tax=Prosthecomicrobium sp. N25 TaxID=3129254 RepID=UPI0030782C55
MDSTIVLFLLQDGLTSGAIYALLGFALVLVFTVTRIIFIPQGEFVAYGALTYAVLRSGGIPGTVWLLMVFGAAALLAALWGGRATLTPRRALSETVATFGPPLAVAAIVLASQGVPRPAVADVVLTVLIVAPLGPYLYRVAFEPLADASILTLFIAAVAVHIAMTALGLAFFGAEGLRAPPLSEASFALGPLLVTGQSLAVGAVALVLSLALWVFFGFTLMGKALRATAVNRVGARLVGIGTGRAGRFAFALAATVGAVSGILVVPVTTIYYDTGFLIGLKGFVAAIVGGLASYPLAGAAALAVGVLEAFAAFEASAYKEVIVFGLVIPVLLFRSFGAADSDEGH